VVPAVEQDALGRITFEQLVPADETLEQITRFLDERRLIGTQVLVEPPDYQGITVTARVRARPGTSPQRLQEAAVEALYRYFSPVGGGPEGGGWPFGRPLHVGEVYAVLQGLPGTEFVEDARVLPADPISGDRGQPVQRVELGPHSLVFSYEHEVQVQGA
jgi:predicted phage baseplate assembly protein